MALGSFKKFFGRVKTTVGQSLPNPVRGGIAALATTGKMMDPDNDYRKDDLKKLRSNLVSGRKVPKLASAGLPRTTSFEEFVFVKENTDRLSHLEHPADRVVDGKKGFRHAFSALHSLHKTLSGKSDKSKLSQKFDGAPSLVFGTHPETNKFFVATKSAWNKTPKINYSHEDIVANHPKSKGLQDKLHHALNHLSKVTPKGKVFQGDIMYSKGDVKKSKGKLQITPNTITYGAKKTSPEGKSMASAKLGIAVHTGYTGKDFASLKSHPVHDTSDFKNHKDVHLLDTSVSSHSSYTPERQERVKKFLGGAVQAHRGVDYSKIEGHEPHIKMYINQTVRNNTRPTVKGYYKHLTTRKEVKPEQLGQVRKNPESFGGLFKAHRYLELAKTQMVHALDSHNKRFETSIQGKPSGPEGYVANGKDKIVKRYPDKHGPGFSAANFAQGTFRK